VAASPTWLSAFAVVRTVTVIFEGLEPQWIKEVQIDAATPVQS
jgi:hypothetical protein